MNVCPSSWSGTLSRELCVQVPATGETEDLGLRNLYQGSPSACCIILPFTFVNHVIALF